VTEPGPESWCILLLQAFLALPVLFYTYCVLGTVIGAGGFQSNAITLIKLYNKH
jgi:hypothetical protein